MKKTKKPKKPRAMQIKLSDDLQVVKGGARSRIVVMAGSPSKT